MKAFTLPWIAIAVLACSVYSAQTITVSKSGGGAFTSIQAAINAANPGDVIQITDSSVYNEQVTFDSSKCPMTLLSKNPNSLNKPKIVWQDKANVSPHTYAESQVDSLITYDKNGALRLIKARGVIIDGIAIDGGGSFAYFYDAIWGNLNPLLYGNTAIALWHCGDIIIRNCDISNAYFGIQIKDLNPGGIFAQSDPTDLDTSNIVPLSAYGRIGNHLIERNRIHNNSFGIYSESQWDQGSTIRYNLIYENHHTSTIDAALRAMPSEWSNQPGGAFFFKDVQLSPMAIYNNTFYKNFMIFAGHWQAGYQHLVFNNIFGPPNKYWSTEIGFSTSMDITPALTNRIYNSIYSAQVRPPQTNYTQIMDRLQQIVGTGGAAPDPGALLQPGSGSTPGFPATSDVRWLEMDSSMFISIDPASANFLEPNWNNQNVASYIKNKGWEASGVKNTDGSRADLGAIEQAHGKPSFVGTINATYPIILGNDSNQVAIRFTLDQREGTTMTNPEIKLFRLVRLRYKKDSFGPDAMSTIAINASDMSALTPPVSEPVRVGDNSYSITASIPGDYAFIEMIIEATGADGKRFTASVGFLPYRKIDYRFVVEIWDTVMSKKLDTARVGEPLVLRLTSQTSATVPFTKTIKPVSVISLSGFEIFVPGNPLKQLAYPTGITGGVDNKKVIFTRVPESGIELISASGTWLNTSTSAALPFLGTTSIILLPGPAEDFKFSNPPSRQSMLPARSLPIGQAYACSLYVYDAYNNTTNISSGVKINTCYLNHAKILVNNPDTIFMPNSQGLISFNVQTTENAAMNDQVGFIAQLVGKTKCDTGEMVVGPTVGVAFNPDTRLSGIKQLPSKEATVSLFDLQGRRVLRRTFLCYGAVWGSSEFLRALGYRITSKAYVMETIVKDKTSLKQTRSVQKILVR